MSGAPRASSRSITVRPLRDDEGARYLEIVNRAIRGLATSHYTAEMIAGWVVPVTKENVSEFMRNPDDEIRLVAELGGVPVAVGALVPTRSELRGCYVSPDAARQGCGSALVSEMERLARARGVTHLELAASLNAEPFYAAHGYEVRERSDVVLTNGHRMPCVWMLKALVVLVLLGLWCTPVAAQTWTGASVSGRWGQPHVDASSMGTEQSTPSARAAVVDPFSPSRFDAALGLSVATGVGLDAVPRSPLTILRPLNGADVRRCLDLAYRSSIVSAR